MGSPEAPHYVPQPRFLFFLRIAQLVLSVIVLGLTAFAMSQLANFFMNGSFGYAIFCSIYSLVGIGYILIAETMFINIWQRYVVLLLDVFGVIFWISAWGALAAWAAIKDVSVNALSHYNRRDAFPKKDSSSDYTYTSSDYTNDYYDLLRGSSSYPGKYNLQAQMAAWRCIAAAAALGALIWFMYFVILVTYSIALHRYRRASRENNQAAGVPVQVEAKSTHEMNNVPVYGQQGPYTA